MGHLKKGGIVAVFVFVFLVFLVNVVISYRNTSGFIDASGQVAQAHQVREILNGVFSDLKDIQRGVRGLVITGDQVFLDPYRAGLDELDHRLIELADLSWQSPRYRDLASQVTDISGRIRLQLMHEVSLCLQGKYAEAGEEVKSGAVKTMMDNIGTIVEGADAEEAKVLDRETSAEGARGRTALFALIGGGIFGSISLLIVFAFLYREIGSRQRVTEEVTVQKAFFEGLFEGSPEGVFVIDADSRIVNLNGVFEKMFGYTKEESIGTRVTELIVPPELASDVASIIRRAFAGETVSAEGQGMRKDGTLIDISLLGTPVKVAADRVMAYGICRDISERRRAEQERERLIGELQGALLEVKTLSGLLPICAYCKKVRDDQGYYHQIEAYITRHSTATFTHGVCPDCVTKFGQDDTMHHRAAGHGGAGRT